MNKKYVRSDCLFNNLNKLLLHMVNKVIVRSCRTFAVKFYLEESFFDSGHNGNVFHLLYIINISLFLIKLLQYIGIHRYRELQN